MGHGAEEGWWRTEGSLRRSTDETTTHVWESYSNGWGWQGNKEKRHHSIDETRKKQSWWWWWKLHGVCGHGHPCGGSWVGSRGTSTYRNETTPHPGLGERKKEQTGPGWQEERAQGKDADPPAGSQTDRRRERGEGDGSRAEWSEPLLE